MKYKVVDKRKALEVEAAALAADPAATVNHEGGLAFNPSAQLGLYLRSCASFLEDKFYESATSEALALRKLALEAGQKFTLQMAAYARNEMHLRSLPVMLLAEAAAIGKQGDGPSIVRQYAPQILKRADEPAELIAYWIKTRGSKSRFPNALKKGISDAMKRFDEYQLAKYDSSAKSVKLRNVLGIAHPAAGARHRPLLEPHKKGVVKAWDVKDAERERFDLYGRAFNGTLATPDTWETYISANGSTAETWDAIAPKMGLFALVRNLRNFEEKGATGALAVALTALRDPVQVQKSQMLPFRWLSAVKATSSSVVQDALRDAMDLSVANVPRWNGLTAVFSDNSASMDDPVSAKSTVRRRDVAGLMAAISIHLSEGEYGVGAFGDTFEWVKLSRRDSVLTNAYTVEQTQVGHSTFAHLCIDALLAKNQFVDRVILFSDMQCYSASTWAGSGSLAASWSRYLASVNRKAVLYSVDLAGYGTMQFQETNKNVVQLSGWSDGVLKLIPALDAGASAVEVVKNQW